MRTHLASGGPPTRARTPGPRCRDGFQQADPSSPNRPRGVKPTARMPILNPETRWDFWYRSRRRHFAGTLRERPTVTEKAAARLSDQNVG